jgi:hypothetical protein
VGPRGNGAHGSHDGIFSTLSAYYSTEELYFCEREVLVPNDLANNSSLGRRGNRGPCIKIITLPILSRIGKLHNSSFTGQKVQPSRSKVTLDYRLTESEGLAAFTALQRQGYLSS